MKKISLEKTLGIALAVAALPLATPLFGCDLQLTAAGTTIAVTRRASPGVNYMRDPAIAEAAIPSSLQQFEGLLYLLPDDGALAATAARAYASYGYGFVEDRLEIAEQNDASEEELDELRWRTSAAYVRAREIAIGWLDRRHPEGGGLLALQREGLDAFTRHVQRFEGEEEGEAVFWAAYSWARYISLHRDDMSAIADLPFVTALAERAYEIDPAYFDYAPVALRAGLMAAAPPNLGGRPADAKVEIDRAIELTGRRNLLFLVTEAQLCAIPLQDRALFQSLLEEAIRFDVDSYPEQRLPNTLAQRRAQRYLDRIDDFFAPEDDGSFDDAEDDASSEGDPGADADEGEAPASS